MYVIKNYPKKDIPSKGFSSKLIENASNKNSNKLKRKC